MAMNMYLKEEPNNNNQPPAANISILCVYIYLQTTTGKVPFLKRKHKFHFN